MNAGLPYNLTRGLMHFNEAVYSLMHFNEEVYYLMHLYGSEASHSQYQRFPL